MVWHACPIPLFRDDDEGTTAIVNPIKGFGQEERGPELCEFIILKY